MIFRVLCNYPDVGQAVHCVYKSAFKHQYK